MTWELGCNTVSNWKPDNSCRWLIYVDSFDVITEISFSMSVEFLKKGSDIGDYIEKLDEAMDADAPVYSPLLRRVSVPH